MLYIEYRKNVIQSCSFSSYQRQTGVGKGTERSHIKGTIEDSWIFCDCSCSMILCVLAISTTKVKTSNKKLLSVIRYLETTHEN